MGSDKTSDIVTGIDAGTPSATVLDISDPIIDDGGIGLKLLRRLAPELESVGMGQATQTGDSAHLVWLPSSLDDPTNIAGQGGGWTGAVAYIDGDTCGMESLPIIQEAKNSLLLDALADPGGPGTVVKLIGDQIPQLLMTELFACQIGLLDLLITACLLGQEPKRVGAVGVVYESTDMVTGLSNTALGDVEGATEVVRELIDSWLASERDSEV